MAGSHQTDGHSRSNNRHGRHLIALYLLLMKASGLQSDQPRCAEELPCQELKHILVQARRVCTVTDCAHTFLRGLKMLIFQVAYGMQILTCARCRSAVAFCLAAARSEAASSAAASACLRMRSSALVSSAAWLSAVWRSACRP